MTRESFEKKLASEADKLKLSGARRRAYIDGPLNAVFPPQRKKKLTALLRAQANPIKKKTTNRPHQKPTITTASATGAGATATITSTDTSTDTHTSTTGNTTDTSTDTNAKNARHARGVVKRKKNPVTPANKQTQIECAMKLFKRFRLDDPQFVDELKVLFPEVAMTIGTCDGVLYTTKRNGKVEHYVHEFAQKSKPILAASWDGKQLLILGGRYDFTQDGITDY